MAQRIGARAIFSLLRYRPGELAERLTMPLLVCVAEGDTAGSVALAIRAAHRAPNGELRFFRVNHFAVYVGDVMQQLIADETAFFRAHLSGAVSVSGALAHNGMLP
jgi:hypothetical protein